MKKICILGSTGSIGVSLLNILKKDLKKTKIELLTANIDYKKILNQAIFFKVKNIIITDYKSYLKVKKMCKNKNINVYNNYFSLNKIFKNKKIDYTMNAIAGLSGLEPTLNIIPHTKKIAIANKESIICGWSLILKKLKINKTEFVPVDSEHFSIFSLIKGTNKNNIKKVYITASGGPFLSWPLHKFKFIRIKDALKHPNWKMGKKITIDSSTMMNKIFEIIEAKKIFNYEYNKLSIITHPKSYVHAIVQFKNGLTKMLIHDTTMIIPIFNTLYPNYEKHITPKKLNFDLMNNLDFKNIDPKKFPVIKILDFLPKKDSLFETILVAANDELVNLFLQKKINFSDISTNLLKIVKIREFDKFKKIRPKNVDEINKLSKYVSLKVNSICI
jgi:1-deoxy-D-xylulose-5-phosphate reductoisomerase